MEIARPIPGWTPSTPAVPGPSVDEIAQGHPAIAIHFWAPWNAYDPPMDRSIREIAERFAGRVQFVSCDVAREENIEVCRRFGVANVPAVGILVSGHRPNLIAGYREPEGLASEIEARLNGARRRRWWGFRR